MGVLDLFSKRQKRLRGEVPDVYVYEDLPNALRVQIVHIIRDALGNDDYHVSYASNAYSLINKTLCREYGVFELIKHVDSEELSVLNFFLQEKSIEKCLDVVELFFKFIQFHIGNNESYQFNAKVKMKPIDAISELNERFKEHGVGYQFESGEIIRVDSQFLHSEAVKPVLVLLHDNKFAGANEEFLKAHEHYRHGRYKECLVDSLKAFESTMKAICVIRKWTYSSTDTAKGLIATCISKGLFPTYFETQFSSMRSLLESGIPTVRNKNGGHGQGSSTIAVPEYLARYALNLTATTILFMIESHNSAIL